MSRLSLHYFLLLLLTGLLAAGCSSPEAPVEAPAAGSHLFTRLSAAYTGVDFENRLEETEAFNVFTYRNYYNGGGVGVGDFNGDGLPDLYLTANQQPNRLYLNRGALRFEDVTRRTDAAGERAWSTGVSLADVNGDGRLDIYVANSGIAGGGDTANELFINEGNDADGIPRFSERATAYGLADEGYGTHAAFFDYDRDGDLDAYLLNNSFRDVSSFGLRNIRDVRHERGGDKLMRNEAGRFVDVSEEAGIYGSEIAFGLGVTVGDVNRDGWLDLYISNDFFERDYLYLNQGDGTFREVLEEQMPHTSLSSMGADMADLTGDGYPEIYVTDMLPEGDRRLKTTSQFESWDIYQAKLRNGYHHQVMRNMLHRNNGDGTFSDVAQIGGVHATDWSWAALLADLDNDGYRDIFVSNGIARDLTNQDFIDFFANEARQVQRRERNKMDFLNLLERIPSTPIANYAFHHDGATGRPATFTNRAAEWGLDTPSFSNGAAYGDLDGDGDLDLVVNNVNAQAFVYRNDAETLYPDRHYLKVRLVGAGLNPYGVGAMVTVRDGERRWHLEQVPIRGFQSSVDPVLTTGLGAVDTLDAVEVVWPDGRWQVLDDVASNQTLVVEQHAATSATDAPGPPAQPETPLLADVTERVTLPYRHVENRFVDFDREGLLFKMLSTEGPALASGDVDGDGRTDLYLGGAKESAGTLLLQRRDGFAATSENVFAHDEISEDLGSAFFDADGDGDLDLYVVSGGYEYGAMSPALQDRLYLNDGSGRFEKTRGRLPSRLISGSCVAPADYDDDGDVDLFVGGRVVPWQYGRTPPSQLLQNDGTGRFRDVTDELAPGLSEAGMVTDAVWTDTDGDGRLDLVVVGEWMPIRVLRNIGDGGLTVPKQPTGLEERSGLWNRLVAHDFDSDGDMDFVVGNLGLNTRLRTRPDAPMTLHVADFDRNGSVEQILSFAKHDGEPAYPMPLRDALVGQLNPLKKRYTKHADYAEQTVEQMLPPEMLERADVLHARTLATSYVENRGDGTFRLTPLPYEAQLAPAYGLLARDVDGDGQDDLLLAGNFFGVKPELGRMDASYGTFLRGDGRGGFTSVPTRGTGFRVTGQARDLKLVQTDAHGPLIFVVKNDDAPQLFRHR